jgi:hypothetical protein
MTGRTLRPLRLALLTLLVCGLAGCSRSQKFGTAISAKDVAKAMPEFTLVMPPGATYVYLERFSRSPVSLVYLKLTVPRISLTNFLTASGLNGTLLPVPAGTFGPASGTECRQCGELCVRRAPRRSMGPRQRQHAVAHGQRCHLGQSFTQKPGFAARPAGRFDQPAGQGLSPVLPRPQIALI